VPEVGDDSKMSCHLGPLFRPRTTSRQRPRCPQHGVQLETSKLLLQYPPIIADFIANIPYTKKPIENPYDNIARPISVYETLLIHPSEGFSTKYGGVKVRSYAPNSMVFVKFTRYISPIPTMDATTPYANQISGSLSWGSAEDREALLSFNKPPMNAKSVTAAPPFTTTPVRKARVADAIPASLDLCHASSSLSCTRSASRFWFSSMLPRRVHLSKRHPVSEVPLD
jgi:hypothetical protein